MIEPDPSSPKAELVLASVGKVLILGARARQAVENAARVPQWRRERDADGAVEGGRGSIRRDVVRPLPRLTTQHLGASGPLARTRATANELAAANQLRQHDIDYAENMKLK